MTSTSSTSGFKEFWSYKFEAGEAICRFDEMVDEQHYDREGGIPVPYKLAGGNVRIVGRGEMSCILPPFYAAFRERHVGPNKRMVSTTFTLRFSLGVVSACAAIDSDDDEGSNLLPLTLHHLYPAVNKEARWLQPPEYDDPPRHFMRHIKRLCTIHELDPHSLAVQSAKAWDCSAPDLFPTCCNPSQPTINGHMWSERSQKWVFVQGMKGKKDNIVRSNGRYWFEKKQASRQAMNDYKTGDARPVASSVSGSEYEPSDDELDWWCSQRDVPDWACTLKRQRFATDSDVSSRAS